MIRVVAIGRRAMCMGAPFDRFVLKRSSFGLPVASPLKLVRIFAVS